MEDTDGQWINAIVVYLINDILLFLFFYLTLFESKNKALNMDGLKKILGQIQFYIVTYLIP